MRSCFKHIIRRVLNSWSRIAPSKSIRIIKSRLLLYVLFSYRYDEKYVNGLLSNVGDICDAFVVNDDTQNYALWYHEGRARNRLVKEAKMAGADWVLCLDPDERIAESDLLKIRHLMHKYRTQKVIFEFPFREMWSKNEYRIDGVWATKTKRVMFPLLRGQKFQSLRLHSAWCPMNKDYKTIRVDIPIYHLKMMNSEDRIKRAQIYRKIDPNKVYQPIGYDYLTDETGIRLAPAPTDLTTL